MRQEGELMAQENKEKKMSDQGRKALGRGLSVLLGESDQVYDDGEIAGQRITQLPVDHLRPGEYQPRKEMVEEELSALKESILEHGVLQPIIVRQLNDENYYEIVAGERRWRASIEAGLTEVPVIIKTLTNEETLEIGLVENLQRENLNAIEEAEGYKRLMDEFSYTQDRLSKLVGKSRSYVTNTLRLLHLPSHVQSYVSKGDLTAGHGKVLLGLEQNVLEDIIQKILKKKLSVRQVEQLVKKIKNKTENQVNKVDFDDVVPSTTLNMAQIEKNERLLELQELEGQLSDYLDIDVKIDFDGKKGVVKMAYGSLKELDQLLEKLTLIGQLKTTHTH